MKGAYAAAGALILASALLGLWLQPLLPERMATHWGAAGEVNGYMPKAWAYLLLPAVSAIVLAFLMAIPSIDPLRANIAKFRGQYDRFVVVIAAFMAYIQALTLLWNVGLPFNMTQALVPAFSALLWTAGTLMESSQPNWFIGVRTPWTLSSPRVWEKTNRLGGRLFKACAVVSLLGLAGGDWAIYPLIVPVLLAAAYMLVYSYLEYRREGGA